MNDILDMSKLESDDIVLAHETFSITQLHEEVISIVETQAAEAGLTIYHDAEPVCPFPYVYGSPLHLRQILLNIYGNAIKYSKISGSIHFTPGACYADAYNGNVSAVHWDLVLVHTEEFGGGEIYFDDVLVRKNGRFVLPELEGLNPENLI